jgi:[ribosomal protein S5]-alanine N-acetyltransferase
MSVAAIATPRLALVSLDARSVELILAGDEVGAGERLGVILPPDLGRTAEGLLRIRLHDLRTTPEVQPWLLRIIAIRSLPRRMVGFVGFHGRPDPAGRVEIGYEVLPEYRRRGIASEAVRGMLEWARPQGVRTFVASIRPENDGSRALATQLGFRPTGSRWGVVDETELLYELPADALPTWTLPPRTVA